MCLRNSLTHCGLVTSYGDINLSTLDHVMACCLMAPSHYLKIDLLQGWLIISKVQWHSSECNFTRDTSAIIHWNYLKNYLSKFCSNPPRANGLIAHILCVVYFCLVLRSHSRFCAQSNSSFRRLIIIHPVVNDKAACLWRAIYLNFRKRQRYFRKSTTVNEDRPSTISEQFYYQRLILSILNYICMFPSCVITAPKPPMKCGHRWVSTSTHTYMM